ncbi:MAG: ABC transporter permease [Massiliimalia sp.]|jgi:ABC-2 type transport system permease protein
MKKYLSFFRIRFLNSLQYRAAAWAGISTQFAWGFLLILMFGAFYRTDPESFPMTYPQLVSYIWMQQAFFALLNVYSTDNEIYDSIVSGNIAYELCRPMDLYLLWSLKTSAVRLAKVVLRCPPILLVAIFLPKPYRLILPDSWQQFGLFLMTMILGILAVITIENLLYVISMYTVSSQGVRIIYTSLAEFASGGFIPLPFLPPMWQAVLEKLPFAAVQVPLRVYSGDLSGSQALEAIVLQVVWIAFLTVLNRFLLSRALGRIVVQGG